MKYLIFHVERGTTFWRALEESYHSWQPYKSKAELVDSDQVLAVFKYIMETEDLTDGNKLGIEAVYHPIK